MVRLSWKDGVFFFCGLLQRKNLANTRCESLVQRDSRSCKGNRYSRGCENQPVFHPWPALLAAVCLFFVKTLLFCYDQRSRKHSISSWWRWLEEKQNIEQRRGKITYGQQVLQNVKMIGCVDTKRPLAVDQNVSITKKNDLIFYFNRPSRVLNLYFHKHLIHHFSYPSHCTRYENWWKFCFLLSGSGARW